MKNISFSFTVPHSLLSYPQRFIQLNLQISNRISRLFSSFGNNTQQFSTGYQDNSYASKMRRMKRFFKNSFFLPIAVAVILVLLLIGFVIKNATSGSATVLSDDLRYELPKAKATQTLNKSFSFPLRDADGKEVSKLAYLVRTAEVRDEIIVKGERNRAVKGRTFLILNLKITNTFDRAVSINARDYIRLTVNNGNEKLASSIHSDPVEVDPISTKYTRLGFAINETDKNLVLQIGEIKGRKETVTLSLK